jgi:protein-disulfide isomerase
MHKATAIAGTALALVFGGLLGHHLAHPRARPAAPPVTVIEFSDFECPACGHAEPLVQSLRRRYGDRLNLVWKNLPLDFHPHAHLAAEAALAAGAQGHFWEMHDRLFAHQRELDRASLEADAAALHLDLPRFRRALDTHQFAAAVDADAALAGRLGVNATPTFFVDGQRLTRWDLQLGAAVANAMR